MNDQAKRQDDAKEHLTVAMVMNANEQRLEKIITELGDISGKYESLSLHAVGENSPMQATRLGIIASQVADATLLLRVGIDNLNTGIGRDITGGSPENIAAIAASVLELAGKFGLNAEGVKSLLKDRGLDTPEIAAALEKAQAQAAKKPEADLSGAGS